MKINLSNFETSDVSLFDVSIVQRDVGGGKTEKEDIDCLEEYPTAKSLIISGLNQECFEYLIKHYGSQFEAISFWKNKSVSDLSPLEDLTNVKFIHFFFNQKATDLWNMERNEKLSGLSIYDFSIVLFRHLFTEIEESGIFAGLVYPFTHKQLMNNIYLIVFCIDTGMKVPEFTF